MADATLAQVSAFFGYGNLALFRKEWTELDAGSKAQIKIGIGNGSYTY